MKSIFLWLARLPQKTAPFDIVAHPNWYFVWRELWHVSGSIFVAMVTLVISKAWDPFWIVGWSFLAASVSIMEADDMRKGQSKKKTAADTAAWLIPFLTIFIWSVR